MSCPICNTALAKHPPARCLDGWIAHVVFGWKFFRSRKREPKLIGLWPGDEGWRWNWAADLYEPVEPPLPCQMFTDWDRVGAREPIPYYSGTAEGMGLLLVHASMTCDLFVRVRHDADCVVAVNDTTGRSGRVEMSNILPLAVARAVLQFYGAS